MKLVAKLLISIFVGLASLAVVYPTTPTVYGENQEIVYVGSRNSNKYHYPSCQWARKIKPGNLVAFGNKAEATQAGYVPCKVCRP